MLQAIFRPMLESDLPAVRALWESSAGVGLNESDSPERLAAYLARNPGQSLVALDRESGQVLAAALCGNDGRRAYLYHLAVAPSHRRRGLGRELVGRCLQIQREMGMFKCTLVVYADNEEAKKFWAGNHFSPRPDLLLLQTPLSVDQ